MPNYIGRAELVYLDGTTVTVHVTQYTEEYSNSGHTLEFTCRHYLGVFPTQSVTVPIANIGAGLLPVPKKASVPAPKGKLKRKLAL